MADHEREATRVGALLKGEGKAREEAERRVAELLAEVERMRAEVAELVAAQ